MSFITVHDGESSEGWDGWNFGALATTFALPALETSGCLKRG